MKTIMRLPIPIPFGIKRLHFAVTLFIRKLRQSCHANDFTVGFKPKIQFLLQDTGYIRKTYIKQHKYDTYV